MRARWCAVILAMVVLLWSTPAWAVTVAAVALPLPAGSPATVATVKGANDDGVLVGSFYVSGTEHAIRWQGGAYTDINPAGVTWSRALTVNASGVVGIEYGTGQAGLIDGGTFTPLAPSGATQTTLLALNDAGQALIRWAAADGWHLGRWDAGTITEIGTVTTDAPGARMNDGGDVAAVQNGAAFLWTPSGTTPIATGTVTVGGVNATGQVVGTLDGNAFTWQGGQLTDLGPGGATAVNDAGQVVGFSGSHAYLWSGGVATDLGGTNSRAVAINADGIVLGYGESNVPPCTGCPGADHPLAWYGGTTADLTPNALVFARPTLVTDTGYVVGYQQAGHQGQPSRYLVPKAWRVR